MSDTRTAYRTCPLCEATCGLAIDIDAEDNVVKVRGDRDDVFSQGFVCPKGIAIGELHHDPDRLRAPLVRGEDGVHREATWEEAFAVADRVLSRALEHGRDAVGVYLGNPSAHSLSGAMYGRPMMKAIGTKNVFSASTLDQMPKHVACGLVYGHPATIPVPDVDRCDLLVVIGGNPATSNGSLWTVPNARGRLRALRQRGGRLVVVDPRRTRTAEEADEHLAIRPGTDAMFLAAIVATLAEDSLIDRAALDGSVTGVDEVLELCAPFTPERVEDRCGIPAAEIRALARALAETERAAVYGRLGTCTQRFGTLASWLVEVVNVLAGNLDREGGSMFALAAAGQPNAKGEPGRGRGMALGRWASRVSGRPEVMGELSVSCLAEEIETPGDGQIRAMVTLAGNPVLSAPDGDRLDAAFASLDGMVAVDIYLNETTRHADVILPPPSQLERSHYDIFLYPFAVRSVANWSGPAIEKPEDHPDEWEILLRLTAIAAGAGPEADIEAIDSMVIAEAVRREGLEPEFVEELSARRGPERLLDLLLRTGPFGVSLDELEAAPHGIDFGPMQPRLPDALRTPSGQIELAPDELVADVPRLLDALDEPLPGNGTMLLIGRRQLLSNNSWMHNLPALVRGPERCTVLVNPDDAARLGIADGERTTVRGPAGEVELPAEVTDAIRPGVVSIPHGWGHNRTGMRTAVAEQHAGVNVNQLLQPGDIDPLSGNAVQNGVPVEVAPAAVPA